MSNTDIFYLNKVYKEPDKIFSFTYKEVNEVKDSCIFVLDTNVLLIPYFTSKDSLDDFENIFNKLKNDNRLFIPSRVAREFATNRGAKLGSIFAKIHEVKDQINSCNFRLDDYPILEGQSDYGEIKKIQDQLNKLKVVYRAHLDKLANYVQQWNWNDPVSRLYKIIFTEDIIIDVKEKESELAKNLEFRIQHEIPPGYKDSKKIDRGIGDLIIWQTILEIGHDKNNDIIFVTNEKKNDWFYIQYKTGLYPRFELFEEFRCFTGGKSINIISFSDFLDILEAKQQTVADVAKSIEQTSSESENKASEVDNIKENCRIFHPKYGYGTVLKVSERPDNSKIGSILFDEYGEKQLLLHVHRFRLVDEDVLKETCIISQDIKSG